MVGSLDRMAVWKLVTTVDAFLSAGFTPAELVEAVHPSDVAMPQGTRFGGMTSMRKLFVDCFLGEEISSDILQETLTNVVAAHTMQAFVGGYGSMIHPVGACATVVVSIEEGMDKIHCGKADFVVAGAVDDIFRGIHHRFRQYERDRGFQGDGRQGHQRALLLPRR